MIDAATPMTGKARTTVFQDFPGPVLLQDGAYPVGRLIAPPQIAKDQGGNRFRQGGCFLSGVVPVLAAFQDVLVGAQMHLVMQYDGREADFLIAERTNTFRVVDQYRARMQEELGALLTNAHCEVKSVIQIPGMLHYAIPLEMVCRGSFSIDEIRTRLQQLGCGSFFIGDNTPPRLRARLD